MESQLSYARRALHPAIPAGPGRFGSLLRAARQVSRRSGQRCDRVDLDGGESQCILAWAKPTDICPWAFEEVSTIAVPRAALPPQGAVTSPESALAVPDAS